MNEWSSSGGSPSTVVTRSISHSSHSREGSDAGFSVEPRVSPLPGLHPWTEASKAEIQQRRLSPTSRSRCAPSAATDPRPAATVKRRHPDEEDAKERQEEEDEWLLLEQCQSPSLPLTDSRLLFAALRKQKLDQFLNLTADNRLIKKEEDEKGSPSGGLEEEEVDSLHHNKTDLFLLSQLKQLNKVGQEEKEAEVDVDISTKKESCEYFCPGTPDKTNSGGGNCFSQPIAVIRFPVERSLQPHVSQHHNQQQQQQQQQQYHGPLPCKWEGCEEDKLESEEKLLDHIKVGFGWTVQLTYYYFLIVEFALGFTVCIAIINFFLPLFPAVSFGQSEC